MNYLEADATISPCGTWRYELTRVWDYSLTRVMFVMLNPSTADGAQDDPTIRRCVAFAKAWGHGSLVVTNLFALRATDPKELKRAAAPVGPANWPYLHKWAAACPLRIAAWGGAWGGYMARATLVRADFAAKGFTLHHLGLTKDGHPKHPLYLKGDCVPLAFAEDTP